MVIRLAEFLGSATKYADCPKPAFPEYAFTGRSNVGKSSLINMLCGQKNLARISSAPGKTTLINHFLINNSWYLVDLPGYGFAKTSRTERETWKKMVTGYLLNRKNLMTVFVLVDIHVPPQKSDSAFMEFLGSNSIPFVILFTKSDKVKRSMMQRNVERFRAAMNETWEELPLMMVTSAIKKTGRDEIISYIEETNRVFTSSKK